VRRRAPLVGIGLVAGLFSGMFGVGGGIIIVPLLVAACAYPPRQAMATSLAAILFTATAAAAAHAEAGTFDWRHGALIGLPAVAGAAAGAWLQQRLHPQRLVLGFAALLVVVAIRLAV
jgi:uncharacterized protein